MSHKVLMLVRYLFAGGTGLATNLAVLYTWSNSFGWYYLFSVALALLVSFMVSFVLQKFWTFQDRAVHHLHHQAAKYFIVFIASFISNLALMYVLVSTLGVWYVLAQILTSGLLAMVSFFIYKNKIFIARSL